MGEKSKNVKKNTYKLVRPSLNAWYVAVQVHSFPHNIHVNTGYTLIIKYYIATENFAMNFILFGIGVCVCVCVNVLLVCLW